MGLREAADDTAVAAMGFVFGAFDRAAVPWPFS
jgi:hypothetical protein